MRQRRVEWRPAFAGATGTQQLMATVPYSSAIAGSWVANLSGLTPGTSYTVTVVSYNATGLGPSTTGVLVTTDATGPAAVMDLMGIAVA